MQLLTIWLIFWCQFAAANPHPSIYGFDEIVVVIEENLITKSDVTKEKALIKTLPMESGIVQGVREKNPLEGLILIELILQMAGDTSLYKAKEEDISSRLETFIAQWETPDSYNDFLTSNHINEDYLKQVIEQHIVAEQYVNRNLGIVNQTESLEAEEKFQNWVLLNKEKVSIRYLN